MLFGLDRTQHSPELSKAWGKVGLVCNQASLNSSLEPAWKIFQKLLERNLIALFGPQHGFVSTVQDNMIETDHLSHGPGGLPVYSLYSETRVPTEEMLNNIDTLVIDLPVTGTRIYTYKYTTASCLRAAKKYGKKVVVLDRPNPLGGEILAGNVLDKKAASFVGEFEIPMRHGLTMGEAAQFFNLEIGAELEVIALEGWNPKTLWPATKKPWIITSPNMPTLDTVFVFPGMVLLEGTNLSEGRGTCLPFQFIGAPFVNQATKLIDTIYNYMPEHKSYHLRETAFLPGFSKFSGEVCQGFQIHVLDAATFNSYDLGLATIRAFIDLHPDKFKWRSPPYEYVRDLLPIKILMGSLTLDEKFKAKSFNLKDQIWQAGQADYIERVSDCLLYERTLKSK